MKKSGQTGRQVIVPILMLSLLIVELFVFTWCRVQYVNNGYTLSRERKRHKELVELQKNLKVELGHLKSPQMIESFARKKLALAPPGPDQIITIKAR